MKKIFAIFGLIAMCVPALAATSYTANNRGYQGLANAYQMNQRNTYYMVTQPDVDSACRTKIYNCLADYCGDVTVIPGQRTGKCTYATESELYNYALLCLQRDNSILLPQYGVTGHMGGGTNTAARLCPSYVQQELMSYLSMSNMATQLSKANSSLCVQRRQELEAAMACHATALAYGNETASMLNSHLNDYCGAGVPGGSAEMVSRFATAGNVGANIWGWAEKIVNLDLNNKGADWQVAIDSVLAGYTNRMNLACGDDMQINPSGYTAGGNNGNPTSLQTVAALAVSAAYPATQTNKENPNETNSIWLQVYSAAGLDNYATATQVVNAALTNASTTQNDFLTSAQMDLMQTSYVKGTKVFVISDGAKCFVVPVAALTSSQQSLVAQTFANCVSR